MKKITYEIQEINPSELNYPTNPVKTIIAYTLYHLGSIYLLIRDLLKGKIKAKDLFKKEIKSKDKKTKLIFFSPSKAEKLLSDLYKRGLIDSYFVDNLNLPIRIKVREETVECNSDKTEEIVVLVRLKIVDKIKKFLR